MSDSTLKILVQPLEACRSSHLVGGKAINLGRLIAAGFPVPGGFAVTTTAFRNCRPDSSHIPSALTPAVHQAIAQAYQEMGSPVVAVRSSATAEDLAGASMAGQYDTFLDLQGEEAVIAAVLRCWASLDSPRTRSYLASQGIPLDQVAMAVVVQRLVPSTVAGVLFTANPRSGADDELLIEASWGLGEAVVSGLVQPDIVIIERDTGAARQIIIADKHIRITPGNHVPEPVPEADRRRPCLSNQQIEDLRQLGLRVAAQAGSPQDLEWAIFDDRVFLLQSRAITTLNDSPARIAAGLRAELTQALASGAGPWVRHNLGETVPQPTPLTWSVLRRFMSGAGGFGHLYRTIGFDPAPHLCQTGFLRLIGGRIYLDLTSAPEQFGAGHPFVYDVAALRSDPGLAQEPPGIPRGTTSEQVACMRRLQAVGHNIDRLALDADRHLAETQVPAFLAWVASQRRQLDQPHTGSELLTRWRLCESRVMAEFAPQALLPSVIVATLMGRLRTQLEPWSWEVEPAALAELLAGGGEPDSTVQATAGLREVARGTRALSTWLIEHGHRAPEEFDLAIARWRERPDAALAFAAGLRDGDDPLRRQRQHADTSAAALAHLRAHVPDRELRRITTTIDVLHRYLRWREDGKDALMHGYGLLRELALAAGNHLGIGEAVFFLTEDELAQALTTGYVPLALVAQRRARRTAEARLHLPPVIGEAELPTLGLPPELPSGDRLDAFAIAPGSGSGPARIVMRPEDAGDLGRGYILVCPSTDPAWTPLFVNAAGLVLERGGALSHGAVVARELGIPAVVLDGATRLLAPGEMVCVDGSRGALRRGHAATSETAETSEILAHMPVLRREMPPPRGPGELRGLRMAGLCAVGWAVYFFMAFALGDWSTDHVYRPTLGLLDHLVGSMALQLGRPGTVTAFAVGMAILGMGLQRLLTDHHRLVEAKQRATRATTMANALPVSAPRRIALLAAAHQVPWRIFAASCLPISLLLGPMVMGVLWLTDRVEPRNAPPGTEVQMTAIIDGEYTEPLTVIGLPGPAEARLMPDTEIAPATQTLPAIRATLTALRQRWSSTPSTPGTWDARAAAQAARQTSLADLDAFLAQPLAPQSLSWQLHAPADLSGIFPLGLQSSTGLGLASINAHLGETVSVPDRELVQSVGKSARLLQRIRFDHGPVRSLTLTYLEPMQREPPVFFQPFAWLGSTWDCGWIALYVATYLITMFVLRWLLRLP